MVRRQDVLQIKKERQQDEGNTSKAEVIDWRPIKNNLTTRVRPKFENISRFRRRTRDHRLATWVGLLHGKREYTPDST